MYNKNAFYGILSGLVMDLYNQKQYKELTFVYLILLLFEEELNSPEYQTIKKQIDESIRKLWRP